MVSPQEIDIESMLQGCDHYLGSIILTGIFAGRYMDEKFARLLSAYRACPSLAAALPLASFDPRLLLMLHQATNKSAIPSPVLDRKAEAVIRSLIRAIHPESPIKQLREAYNTATGEMAGEESPSRLYFEFLCFAVFYASFVSPQFIGHKRRRGLCTTLTLDAEAPPVFDELLTAKLACYCVNEQLAGQNWDTIAFNMNVTAHERFDEYAKLAQEHGWSQELIQAYGRRAGSRSDCTLGARCMLCGVDLMNVARSAVRRVFD
jgi:hypothetical protein